MEPSRTSRLTDVPWCILFPVSFQQRQLLRHLLVHLVQPGYRDREVDEDQHDEKDSDEEQEGRGIEDPGGLRGPLQPVLLDGEDQDDYAAEEPEDLIFLPEFPAADHFKDIKEQHGRSADRQDRDPAHPNLRMQLMRKESVTFAI